MPSRETAPGHATTRPYPNACSVTRGRVRRAFGAAHCRARAAGRGRARRGGGRGDAARCAGRGRRGPARARRLRARHAPRSTRTAACPARTSQTGGAKRAANVRRPGQEPSQSEEERGLQQVDRFIATGGATLEGRVVEADGDKPVAGTSIHVHHAGMFVGARTDASGAFHIPGMLPGSRVVVWVGRNGDPFVDERIAVSVPEEGQIAGQVVDAGTVKLLRGDELSSRLGGWVGVFVTRRSGQILASAVSPWLPADHAGLEVGDQILAIDGRDTTGLGPRAVTFLLRGPVGASVTLLVRTLDHDKRKLVLDRVLR